MAFVPYGTTWPSLANFQTQYQGSAASPVIFGASTIFNLQPKGLDGFDLPATRNGDSDRPRQRGEFIGLDLFSGRDLTLTVDVGPPAGSYATLAAALSALRAVTNTADSGNVEYPMFVQFPNSSLLGTMCRVRRRTVPVDLAYSLGNMAQNVAVQFHATDPFFYSQTQQNTIGLPTPGTGLSLNPLTFPLSFGSGGGTSILSLTNAGDVECYPILVITGPCTYPAITNLSVTGSPVIQFGVTMVAGDRLVIDTDLKTATYYSASSPTIGQSAMATLQQNWTWWSMAPGVSQLQFTSTDSSSVAGQLAIQWASAYS